MKTFYTYLHCRPDGTPFYVGKGHGKRSHKLTYRSRFHRNVVDKYGVENIGVFVFPCSSEAEAAADEVQQIAQLRAEGYGLVNLTNGGDGISGYSFSEESKKRKSALFTGRRMSPESREKMRLAKIGYTFSPEHLEKLKFARKGRKPNLGKKHTAETKARMSAAHIGNKSTTGMKNSPESNAKRSESLRAYHAKRKNSVGGFTDSKQ